MNFKVTIPFFNYVLCSTAILFSASELQAKTPAVNYKFGGFIKADAIWSSYSNQLRSSNVGDDFYVPSTVAVNGEGGEIVFDAHAKTSRLWFKSQYNSEVGLIATHIEADFNAGGDERLTNQASLGLRHAFLTWVSSGKDKLLIGQTWSTFFNVGALPEAVDFIGPTAGSVFVRQSQARWTRTLSNTQSIMFAAENPSSGLVDSGSGFGSNQYDSNTMPDVVVRYNSGFGSLRYSAAALLREISYRQGGSSDSKITSAFSFSGVKTFNNGDDLKFMISTGTLGRYIALQAFQDGGIDADDEISLTNTTGGFVAYRHFWDAKLRSTISVSKSVADNPEGGAVSLNKSVQNASANLIYSPVKPLLFGVEYMFAKRTDEAGESGNMRRLQLTAKYSF